MGVFLYTRKPYKNTTDILNLVFSYVSFTSGYRVILCSLNNVFRFLVDNMLDSDRILLSMYTFKKKIRSPTRGYFIIIYFYEIILMIQIN